MFTMAIHYTDGSMFRIWLGEDFEAAEEIVFNRTKNPKVATVTLFDPAHLNPNDIEWTAGPVGPARVAADIVAVVAKTYPHMATVTATAYRMVEAYFVGAFIAAGTDAQHNRLVGQYAALEAAVAFELTNVQAGRLCSRASV